MKYAKLLIVCLALFAAIWAGGAIIFYAVHFLAHAHSVEPQQSTWGEAISESWAGAFGMVIGFTTVLWAKNRNKVG